MEPAAGDGKNERARLDDELVRLHPAWAKLIALCREIGFGELERIKIQNGLPVIADVAKRHVKFT